MQNSIVVLKEKFRISLDESSTHFQRLETAYTEIEKKFHFPINENDFNLIIEDNITLAFADQVIYRFSKTQDSLGGKVFKTFLNFQGDTSERPFLDILNSLEKISILKTEDWFMLRQIRNEIAHDYETTQNKGYVLLNEIFSHREELKKIIQSFYKFI
jgi:hypothetical protein